MKRILALRISISDGEARAEKTFWLFVASAVRMFCRLYSKRKKAVSTEKTAGRDRRRVTGERAARLSATNRSITQSLNPTCSGAPQENARRKVFSLTASGCVYRTTAPAGNFRARAPTEKKKGGCAALFHACREAR
jgi:hypothetical protein